MADLISGKSRIEQFFLSRLQEVAENSDTEILVKTFVKKSVKSRNNATFFHASHSRNQNSMVFLITL